MNQTRDRCARPRQRRKEGKEPKVFDVFFLYSKRGETLSECAAASGRDDLDRWPVIERVINAVAGERETPVFLLSPPPPIQRFTYIFPPSLFPPLRAGPMVTKFSFPYIPCDGNEFHLEAVHVIYSQELTQH